MTIESTGLEPPKTFISYSWDSPEHKKWTTELTTRLRGDGVLRKVANELKFD
jgi:hypothetical protein